MIESLARELIFQGQSIGVDSDHRLYLFCCSVSQLCLTLWDLMDCSTLGFSVFYHLPELPQTHVHWVNGAIQSSYPVPSSFLLLPSLFPNIRVFSKELALSIRWPKYWSFSFSVSSSNQDSGLVYFRIDWFDLLAVHGSLKSLLQHLNSKASITAVLKSHAPETTGLIEC